MPKSVFGTISILILVLLSTSVGASTPLLDYNYIFVQVSNDAGAKYNPFGNNTYNIRFEGPNRGLNALHISTDPAANYGQVTVTDAQSGTFYATDSGGKGYDDEILLMVAVNGTIPDDFSLRVTADGYTWTPNPDRNQPPTLNNVTYQAVALDETFTIGDFLYGPQIWKPTGNGFTYPIYSGQNMTDTGHTFLLAFIDLNAGVLRPNTALENRGAVRINYSFHNLASLAAFNVYAYCKNSNNGDDMIAWTNAVPGSGYAVDRTRYPVVTGINPDTGPNTTSVSITDLVGINFNTTCLPSVKLNRTGFVDITAASVSTVSSSRITCTFDLTGQPAGARNVVVTNPGGETGMLASGFTITEPGQAPSVFSITPNTGQNTGIQQITNLTGANFPLLCPFGEGPAVNLTGSGFANITATDVHVLSSTRITCTFDLTGQPAGMRNVVVANPDGQEGMLENGFTITAPAATRHQAVFRHTMGNNWIFTDTLTGVKYRDHYGITDDVPLVGDFNNDGVMDRAVFRSGNWIVDLNMDGTVDSRSNYGIPTDVPLVGDFNNDGVLDRAVFRSGNWIVDLNMDRTVDSRTLYGIPGDIPLVGDLNNDGITDRAVFRSGTWIVDWDLDGDVDSRVHYGVATDIPLVGFFDDDAFMDRAVFRNGQWIIDYGFDGSINSRPRFGAAGDIPLAWVTA